MARKERNSIDYFPHSVTHGRKMFYLRSRFKNDGYAVWFMLLEQLGKSEYHYLDLSDKIQLMYLSSECMVSEIVLSEIINILVDFGEFDNELWEKESVLFNEKFIENISDAYKKRNNECVDKKSLISLLASKGRCLWLKSNPKGIKIDLKGVGNTQSILNNIKSDKTKEEEIKEDDILFEKETKGVFNFKNSLIDFGFKKELVNDWLLVRKTKKATNTETAFKKFISEIENSEKDKNEILEICVEKSWSGFKIEYLDNLPKPIKKDSFPTNR